MIKHIILLLFLFTSLIVQSARIAPITGCSKVSLLFSDKITPACLRNPQSIVHAKSGSIYVSDAAYHVIRKVLPNGDTILLAGSDQGESGFADLIGNRARFNSPMGIDIDQHENVYVADALNKRIRKIFPSGYTITIAGGDGVFDYPIDVAVAANGDVIVVDFMGLKIKRISLATGAVSDVAGSGQQGSVDGSALEATFTSPMAVDIDAFGNIFVIDDKNLRKISAIDGQVSTTMLLSVEASIATDGYDSYSGYDGYDYYDDYYEFYGYYDYQNEYSPMDIDIDGDGLIYISNSELAPLISITPESLIVTRFLEFQSEFYPIGISVDRNNPSIIYSVEQYDDKVLKIDMNADAYEENQVIELSPNLNQHMINVSSYDYQNNMNVAWTIDYGSRKDITHIKVKYLLQSEKGYDFLELSALFGMRSFKMIQVSGFAEDAIILENKPWMKFQLNFNSDGSVAGQAYALNGLQIIVEALTSSMLSNVALEQDVHRFNVIKTQPSVALNDPSGLVLGSDGSLFFSDTQNHVIKKVEFDGSVSNFAGYEEYAGCDDGEGTWASFNRPQGLALDSNMNLYVADTSNHVIRKITPAGLVSVHAGSPSNSGMLNSGGTNARFKSPTDVTVTPSNGILVADSGNYMIRSINTLRTVSNFAGSGIVERKDGIGTSSSFQSPNAIFSDSKGTYYVADGQNIRRISSTRVVTSLFGNYLLSNDTNYQKNAQFLGSLVGVEFNSAESQFFLADQEQSKIILADQKSNYSMSVMLNNTLKNLPFNVSALTSNPSFPNILIASEIGENKLVGIYLPKLPAIVNANITTVQLPISKSHNISVTKENYKDNMKMIWRLDYRDIKEVSKFKVTFKINTEKWSDKLTLNLCLADQKVELAQFSGVLQGTFELENFATGIYEFEFTTDSLINGKHIAGDPGLNINILAVKSNVKQPVQFSVLHATNLMRCSLNNDDNDNDYYYDYDYGNGEEDGQNDGQVDDGNEGEDGQNDSQVDYGNQVEDGDYGQNDGQVDYGYIEDQSIESEIEYYGDTENSNSDDEYDGEYDGQYDEYYYYYYDRIESYGYYDSDDFIQENAFYDYFDEGYYDYDETSACSYTSSDIVVDLQGNTYMSDAANNVILKIDMTGHSIIFAGSGSAELADGDGTTASFNQPKGLAIDTTGNIYVADEFNSCIRRIDLTGYVSTVVCNTEESPNMLISPRDLAISADGSIIVADNGDQTIKLVKNDQVSVIAGGGGQGSIDGLGIAASFTDPVKVVISRHGNIFVVDGMVIRKIDKNGYVSHLTLNENCINIQENESEEFCPSDISDMIVDQDENVYISGENIKGVMRINPYGETSVISEGYYNSIKSMAFASDRYNQLHAIFESPSHMLKNILLKSIPIYPSTEIILDKTTHNISVSSEEYFDNMYLTWSLNPIDTKYVSNFTLSFNLDTEPDKDFFMIVQEQAQWNFKEFKYNGSRKETNMFFSGDQNSKFRLIFISDATISGENFKGLNATLIISYENKKYDFVPSATTTVKSSISSIATSSAPVSNSLLATSTPIARNETTSNQTLITPNSPKLNPCHVKELSPSLDVHAISVGKSEYVNNMCRKWKLSYLSRADVARIKISITYYLEEMDFLEIYESSNNTFVRRFTGIGKAVSVTLPNSSNYTFTFTSNERFSGDPYDGFIADIEIEEKKTTYFSPCKSFSCWPGFEKISTTNEPCCRICNGGQFKESIGNSPCSQCPEGYISIANQTSCQRCPAGTEPDENRVSCSECPTGYYRPTWLTKCAPCPEHSTCSPTAFQCDSGWMLNENKNGCNEVMNAENTSAQEANFGVSSTVLLVVGCICAIVAGAFVVTKVRKTNDQKLVELESLSRVILSPDELVKGKKSNAFSSQSPLI